MYPGNVTSARSQYDSPVRSVKKPTSARSQYVSPGRSVKKPTSARSQYVSPGRSVKKPTSARSQNVRIRPSWDKWIGSWPMLETPLKSPFAYKASCAPSETSTVEDGSKIGFQGM